MGAFSWLSEAFIEAMRMLWWMLIHGGWLVFGFVVFRALLTKRLAAQRRRFIQSREWVYLCIRAPRTNELSTLAVEQAFAQMHAILSKPSFTQKYLKGEIPLWYSLEIVSLGGRISFIVRAPKEDRDLVESAFYAQYPEAEISEVQDYLANLSADLKKAGLRVWGKELVLASEASLPIKTYRDFEHIAAREKIVDPLKPLFETLAKLSTSELGAVQIIAMPADTSEWKKRGEAKAAELIEAGGPAPPRRFSLFRLLKSVAPKRLSADEAERHLNYPSLPEMEKERVNAVLRKTSKPGYLTKLRLLYLVPQDRYDASRPAMFLGAFRTLSSGSTNGFLPDSAGEEKLLDHFKERNPVAGAEPYVLNIEELATIYHLPLVAEDAGIAGVEMIEARKSPPPVNLSISAANADKTGAGGAAYFAKAIWRGQVVPCGIKTDDRRRHMYVLGKTGMGKTTMMEQMAIQDIRQGRGLCFIDPHGDSVVRLLDFVPRKRINDVIYLNPADLEYPIGFNPLEAVDAKYRHLVADGLMGVFTKIWVNTWSSRMEYILSNTIRALLDTPGSTMLGITRMYVDKEYRSRIVAGIKDPLVKMFWTDEFANYDPKYAKEAVAPLQNRVGQFLSSALIRNIVGQTKSAIDLREIMDHRKILLIDMAKGKVGEDNVALLGAMIITKLQLAAMSRVDIPEAERADFFLYVDEFQNFVTESFATILSEARKYRLNLIMGHQYVGQLTPDKGNTRLRDAIFGNVGTICCFQVGADDAEMLANNFAPIYEPYDLANLPKYHLAVRLMIDGIMGPPFSAQTLPPDPSLYCGNKAKIIRVSREQYATPVSQVEAKINRWMNARQ